MLRFEAQPLSPIKGGETSKVAWDVDESDLKGEGDSTAARKMVQAIKNCAEHSKLGHVLVELFPLDSDKKAKARAKTNQVSSTSHHSSGPLLHVYECSECDFQSSPGRKFELEDHQKETGHSEYRESFL